MTAPLPPHGESPYDPPAALEGSASEQKPPADGGAFHPGGAEGHPGGEDYASSARHDEEPGPGPVPGCRLGSRSLGTPSPASSSGGDVPHHRPSLPWIRSRQPALPDPAGNSGQALKAVLRQAALTAVAVALTGVLLGLLWLWLAPRVTLISDGEAVYPQDPEGESAVSMDGTFVLLGLGFGMLSAVAVFLRFRGGGAALVVGLAAGGLLGSLLAWRLGVWLGPSQDIAVHARAVGAGVVFDAPMALRAKGALLMWPTASMAVHLGLTAFFGPPDPDPLPDPPH